MEEVHKYLDRFGWILTSYMEMETEGMVKNGWSRIVVFGLVFGGPEGRTPSTDRLDYFAHSQIFGKN